MISPMLKFRMAGLRREKDAVFDLLFKSGCIELKDLGSSSEVEDGVMLSSYQKLRDRLESAINLIEENISRYDKRYVIRKSDISVDELSMEVTDSTISVILDEIDDIVGRMDKLSLDKASNQNLITSLEPYLSLDDHLSKFKSTSNVHIELGTLPSYNQAKLDEYLSTLSLSECESVPDSSAIIVYSHKSESREVTKKLSELGFVRLSCDCDMTAKQRRAELGKEISCIEEREEEHRQKLLRYRDVLPLLKLFYDFNKLRIGKILAEKEIVMTKQAFYLEGFVPKKDKSKLEKLIAESSLAIEYDFINVSKTDNVPTLTNNNKYVRPFEFVTNMYSPPSYRDVDPNIFIMFFFSLFLGFVMADIGYGLAMILLGLLISKRVISLGTRDLMRVIATSGVFAVIFGVMFGSFFGLTHNEIFLVPPAILPSPTKEVLPLLAICLAGGMVQIMVSLGIKAFMLVRRGEGSRALFDAIIWELFFVGLFMVGLDYMGIIGGLLRLGIIISISSIAISVVGQVIINKGITRLTKSVSSIYSVINIFSDILSYARIFGLMLSGYIIADIVTRLTLPMFSSIIGAVFAVIILVVGHSFNLAMGVLSGYIHVSRLQYVEFFSRFYEGEGEIFTPFLSDLTYHNVKN